MEIRELLEIMLDNVKNGEPLDYGLIGYNGVINLEKPEHVHRSPHTYITVDQYNEIRDAHDINTVLNRLNLAIEKLMVVPAQPVTFPIPNGYYVDDLKIPTYQEMRSLGYSEHVLKMQGWLKEQQLPSPPPAVIPEGYLLPVQTREFFKPFIAWVCGGCNHVWPRSDYIFTESQFSNIKDSWFSQRLVGALNGRLDECKPFDSVVSNLSIGETFETVKTMEELVNKRLNEIYQQL